ncbi:SlyX family protein [Thiocystis violacea]|uniref:SlyX family protein n=1 Tax=Thiocystis violacea TaxID=13725 RepID=UPI001908E300|nr:SlyX family protein [Thiocystis violacea]MBK1717154.1 hypothetical protein [Thiocystis violacea]
MDINDKLADLQTRLTYQEDDLRVLNGIITRQQSEIDSLRAEFDRLRTRVGSLAESSPVSRIPEPPPPHY